MSGGTSASRLPVGSTSSQTHSSATASPGERTGRWLESKLREQEWPESKFITSPGERTGRVR